MTSEQGDVALAAPNVWCVRAGGGVFTSSFLDGGYAGVGWNEIAQDLSGVQTKDTLYSVVRDAYRAQET